MLSALSIAAGCSMEEKLSNESVNSGKEITIKAFREGNPETRTVRDENGDVLWTPGDAISLFYGSGTNGGSKFTSTLESGTSAVTNFTGTITAITGGGELTVDDTYFWGVYPYGEDVSCDGASITMTLPTEQTAVAGTFAPGAFPSLGRSQGLIMGFYNICGGWRFSVTKEGVRKVTLKSNGGELITGKVKVGLSDSGIPEIKEIIDGSDEVVLECPRGEYFEVGENYYMVMLPTVFNSGFTMTFETYTEEGVYNRTAKTTISRSKFSGITKLDNYLTTPYSTKTGNIPVEDANFKAYLVENFDTDGDGEISFAEASEITTVSVNTDNIESVQGIEFMPALRILGCSGSSAQRSSESEMSISSGKLTSLDASNNPALTNLRCIYNRITSLNLYNNTALTSLICDYNQLTNLDVSQNTTLTYLECNNNQLTNLDVSQNTTLTHLYCFDNQLTTLDISKNTALESLACYQNLMTDLDVSNNLELKNLSCASNQLSRLDVSKNLELESLSCSNNHISNLDVSRQLLLKFLYCSSNQLTSLNVSYNTELIRLYCDSNKLTSLDVTNNTVLERLRCSSNQLTNLDVSDNTVLTDLYCDSNKLEILDVTNNSALICLDCSSNHLPSLDVSNNKALEDLDCASNLLIRLDVSKNTALTWLDCSPMSTLTTLYIYQGQEIPSVTVDRKVDNIPAETEIVVKQDGGTNEGTGDEELNP